MNFTEIKNTYKELNLASLEVLLNNYSAQAFEKLVSNNGGKFSIKLDGAEISLLHKQHFHFNAKDKQKVWFYYFYNR